MKKVSIIMGSASDYPVMLGAESVLEEFGIPFEKKVISAHRTPDLLTDYVSTARQRDVAVIIAAAGGAAHLAGVAAALTTLPVIAVPMGTKSLGGLDSLLSMVQMPSGIPVATVAIDGAKNSAILAAEIIALWEPSVAKALDEFRDKQRQKVIQTQI